MACTLLTTTTTEEKQASLDRAADVLVHQGLLAFATETVYGLGANALDDAACMKVFEAKERPHLHPLIVHIAHEEQVRVFAQQIPDFARQLMAAFWPGPLTLILPRIPHIARCAAGLAQTNTSADSDNPTIGLRCPSHPLALELLRLAKERGVMGVAAPSANRFGRISPTTAAHVLEEFAQCSLPISILDGGPCSVGVESTIIDCSRQTPVLLRPGHITPSQIQAVIGGPLSPAHTHKETNPRAAGTLASHYAPRAKLRIVEKSELDGVSDKAIATLVLPSHAHQAEQVLFAQLRALDQASIREIWVKRPPQDESWAAVLDRLLRAAY